MYQHILVPVDLTDLQLAKPAIATAVMMAGTAGTIRLINVLPLTPVMLAEYVPPDFEAQQRKSSDEALAIIAGTPPPFLPEGVITLDPWTLETTRHPITIASAKPMGRVKRGRTAPIELASAPKRFTADGGHRTCTPSESLARPMRNG